MKKYIVQLSPAEFADLSKLAETPDDQPHVRHAIVLLAANEGDTDQEIAIKVGLSPTAVARVRRRFVEEGLEAALKAPRQTFEEKGLNPAPGTSFRADLDDEWLWRFRPKTPPIPAAEKATQFTNQSLPLTTTRANQPRLGFLYVISLLLELLILFQFFPFEIVGSRALAVGLTSVAVILLGTGSWTLGCGIDHGSPAASDGSIRTGLQP